jgi:outer membrane protein assembly factor BamB
VNGKPMLVSGAGDVIQGFTLDKGERIWTVFSQGEGVVPSIVPGDGLVYAASGFPNKFLRAVRLDGEGDATQTHIQWEHKKEIPSMASFLYLKPYLYVVDDGGAVQCLKGDTGGIVWREKIKGHYAASPVAAGGSICFLSEEGDVTVIQAGSKFQIVADSKLGETCQASPAIARGCLFIRTEKHLYCMGARP